MRMGRLVGLVLAVLAVLSACAGDGPVGGARLSTVTIRFLTPATVKTLVVEVTGPGISPAVVVNIPVGTDSVASGTLALPAGSGRRFIVTAFDTAGTETHRADTTITLQPGPNPSLSLRLEVSSGTLGVTVTFGGVSLSVTDTSTRVLAVGDSAVIAAYAVRANGDTVTADSLFWGSSSPVTAEVSAGLVRLLREGSADVTVSFEGAAANVRVTCPCSAPALRLSIVYGELGGSAGDVLQPITVEAQDANGLRVPDYNADVFLELVENPTNTWFLGETVTRAVNGIATFDAVGIGLPGAGYRIRARSGDLLPTETDAFSVTEPTAQVDDTAIAASSAAYCALASGGEAYCWGANNLGQLGTGDFVESYVPRAVAGGLTYRSVALGNGHACAVTPGGDAYCWGRNDFGALGDGTTQRSTVPRLVQGGHSWSRVDLGAITTCRLTSVGQAYCWGFNNGRLGTGDSIHRSIPTPVDAPLRFTSLTVGGFSACGVTAGGWVYCWGLNDGRFGNGRSEQSLRPVLSAGARRFSLLVQADLAGPQLPLTCGVTVQSEALCWGWSRQGQFGDGMARAVVALAPVNAMSGFSPRRLAAMEGLRVCAIDGLSRAYCWGQSDGAVGDGGWENRFTPTPVAGNLAISGIATGTKSSCALTTSGALYCWGTDRFGDVDGSTLGITTPVRLDAVGEVTSIELGKAGHACAYLGAGGTKCWGRNAFGQVGNGTTDHQLLPGNPVGGPFPKLGLTTDASCGLRPDGELWCWGRNGSGQLGLPPNTPRQSTVPVQANTALRFSSIAVGELHGCGIHQDQRASCWGLNSSGQRGNGSTDSLNDFDPVVGGRFFSSLAAGLSFTCGISQGRVYCWGNNAWGQAGIGTTNTDEVSPQAVLLDREAVVLTASGRHACLVTDTGDAYCWGANGSGQLGVGASSISQATPVPVAGGIGFTQLAAGALHTCGLTQDGRAYCWGANSEGQLGTGSYAASPAPVEVATQQRFASLSAGQASTCGITQDQRLYCWGSNADGQLLVPKPLSPAPVAGGIVFRVVH
jgi:alpha-tubulin suppressor-like RCC1 family protein